MSAAFLLRALAPLAPHGGAQRQHSRSAGHWRTSLLNKFAPKADPWYVANMSERPAALPPLHPYARRYLDLVELSLTGAMVPEAGECHPDRPLKLPRNKRVGDNAGTCFAVNTDVFRPHLRLIGRDWPTYGVTMVGHARLHNIRHLIEHAVAFGVRGDFVELGVWRGGAAIYARTVLNVLEDSLEIPTAERRKVHLFDAFGLLGGYGKARERGL